MDEITGFEKRQKELLNQIKEATASLENLSFFSRLTEKDKVAEIKSALGNPEKLVTIFHNREADFEGDDAFNTDIWNAEITVGGRTQEYESLFRDLGDLLWEQEKAEE